MAKKRKPTEVEHISAVLPQVLQTLRPDLSPKVMQLWQAWPDVVGAPVSENTKPVAVNNRILLVHVSSSAWLHQLQFLKREILAKLNASAEAAVIDDIVFKIGTT